MFFTMTGAIHYITMNSLLLRIAIICNWHLAYESLFLSTHSLMLTAVSFTELFQFLKHFHLFPPLYILFSLLTSTWLAPLLVLSLPSNVTNAERWPCGIDMILCPCCILLVSSSSFTCILVHYLPILNFWGAYKE